MLPRQVLFLTGPSDPQSCALSPVQSAFLDALPVPESARVRFNFPYDRALRGYRPTPLWLASARHVGLAFRCRRSSFARRYHDPVRRQLVRADRTLVLAGSIGLDLLGRLGLAPPVLDRLDVFAYGAVATRPPACRTFRVTSPRDRLARRWAADAAVDCDHLGYLSRPEVVTLCVEFLHRVGP